MLCPRAPDTVVDRRTYGEQPRFVLNPISGDALIGLNNGRRGILMHGGALNAQGGLRPTWGCLRWDDGTAMQACGWLGAVTSFEVAVVEA